MCFFCSKMLNFVVFLLGTNLVFATPKSNCQPPKITTPSGEIEGAVMYSRLRKPIYAFRGIHYAQPPINELRFKVIYFSVQPLSIDDFFRIQLQ